MFLVLNALIDKGFLYVRKNFEKFVKKVLTFPPASGIINKLA